MVFLRFNHFGVHLRFVFFEILHHVIANGPLINHTNTKVTQGLYDMVSGVSIPQILTFFLPRFPAFVVYLEIELRFTLGIHFSNT